MTQFYASYGSTLRRFCDQRCSGGRIGRIIINIVRIRHRLCLGGKGFGFVKLLGFLAYRLLHVISRRLLLGRWIHKRLLLGRWVHRRGQILRCGKFWILGVIVQIVVISQGLQTIDTV